MKQLKYGFTIVELVIVISVIAILAAISIVAYNGVQDRARYAKAQSDLKHINEALTIYKAQKGEYPDTASAWTYQYACGSSTLNQTFLNTLVDQNYLDTMPRGNTDTSFACYSYAYISNKADYKLLRIMRKSAMTPYTGLPAVEKNNNPLIDDGAQARQNWAWGYWSSETAKNSW